MNSDAAHGTKESNPSDDNSLDVTLLPKNISDNTLFRPNADFIVEWNHERNEVPELLASHGVPLELWQKWLDQMEIFWKDRIENVVSKMLTTWSKHSWLLIPFVCLLFNFVLRFVPHGIESLEKIREISAYIAAFSPFICLLCYVIQIRNTNHNLVFEISEREEEVEKVWVGVVSNLNTGKCQQLGLQVKILRYHLDMIEEDNKFCVPFGIQFSELSEGNKTNVDYQGFQSKEKAVMGNDLSNTQTSPACTSFRFEPQNIVNYSIFRPGRNFKVAFTHERCEVPSLLQLHGVKLHVWQNWFDAMHDLWAKRVLRCTIERTPFFEAFSFFVFLQFAFAISVTSSLKHPYNFLPLYIICFILAFFVLLIFFVHCIQCFRPKLFKDAIEDAWLQFVSDVRENQGKVHGLRVDAIQYDLYLNKDGDDILKRTMTVGLKFSKVFDDDLYDLEGNVGQLK